MSFIRVEIPKGFYCGKCLLLETVAVNKSYRCKVYNKILKIRLKKIRKCPKCIRSSREITETTVDTDGNITTNLGENNM